MNEKLMWLLEIHFNLFHSDLISRAFHDDNVSLEDFISGCEKIGLAEGEDYYDEFVPEEFKNV